MEPRISRSSSRSVAKLVQSDLSALMLTVEEFNRIGINLYENDDGNPVTQQFARQQHIWTRIWHTLVDEHDYNPIY
jgi:hypothetical protein